MLISRARDMEWFWGEGDRSANGGIIRQMKRIRSIASQTTWLLRSCYLSGSLLNARVDYAVRGQILLLIGRRDWHGGRRRELAAILGLRFYC
jgi:hypothetical protein